MLLQNKHCLITGGGTGIGRATAFRLAREGAAVCIAGINEAALRRTAGEIGAGCTWRRCDVGRAEELKETVARMPRLDVLVANAAVSFPVDLLADPLERWREMMEVNLWGVVSACRAAGQKMIEQKSGGRIVIVSSVQSGLAEVSSGPYGMAKAALNQLGRQLAVEWAEHGILTNVVAPGFVRTPMTHAAGSDELESDWFKDFFVNPRRPRVPLRRAAEAKEIAEAVFFFAHPDNTYCTGSVLTVDGGLTAKL
jgi:NAD(P)-dependent dehydrogenase (short-subunit alcohol dehydrogenase family)